MIKSFITLCLAAGVFSALAPPSSSAEAPGRVDPAAQQVLQDAPAYGSAKANLRSNAYWAAILSGAYAEPRKLALATQAEQDLEALALADINAIAAAWMSADRAVSIMILPTGHVIADARPLPGVSRAGR